MLLRPTTRGANWILWAAGPVMLLLALLVAFRYLRLRQVAAPPAGGSALSPEEEARLKEILKD